MRKPVEIENIEEMRRREGIVDAELKKEILDLHGPIETTGRIAHRLYQGPYSLYPESAVGS